MMSKQASIQVRVAVSKKTHHRFLAKARKEGRSGAQAYARLITAYLNDGKENGDGSSQTS